MPTYTPNPPGTTIPFFSSPLVNSVGRNYSINKNSGKSTGNAVIGPKCTKQNDGTTSCKAIKGAMPEKFYPSIGSSMFSRARSTYTGGTYNNKKVDRFNTSSSACSSQHIYLKKINAIGKSSQQSYVNNNQGLAFSGKVQNDVKSALRRTRSGGTVAPAKKGLYLPNPNGSGTKRGVGGLANRSISGLGGNKKQGLPGCCGTNNKKNIT